MNSPEVKKNSADATRGWDMSNIPFAGDEKEKISRALRYAPDLLASMSEVFTDGTGRMSNFTNTILSDRPNSEILNNIKRLDDGLYFESYGVDHANRGFTGLGQVSGALDYFDNKYGILINDKKIKGLIKTSLAMWPVGSMGNYGVQQFAASAKIDKGTASLINLLTNRNAAKLVQARFEHGDQASGEQLLQINENYLGKLNGGFSSNHQNAACVCNLQKIIVECVKNGTAIAKERKAQK